VLGRFVIWMLLRELRIIRISLTFNNNQAICLYSGQQPVM
jgi:hypothetical protein